MKGKAMSAPKLTRTWALLIVPVANVGHFA